MSCVFQAQSKPERRAAARKSLSRRHRRRSFAQGQRSRGDVERAQFSGGRYSVARRRRIAWANWRRWATKSALSRACGPSSSRMWISLSSPRIREHAQEHGSDARDAGSAIVDLSAALEDEAERQRALAVDGARARTDRASGVAARAVRGGASRGGHAGAAVAARTKGRARIGRAVATVFEPASEHGQKGMDELHQQTVNLLSFQPLAQGCFRRAGGFQYGGALRAEVAASAGIDRDAQCRGTTRRLREPMRRSLGTAAAGPHFPWLRAGAIPGDGRSSRCVATVAGAGWRSRDDSRARRTSSQQCERGRAGGDSGGGQAGRRPQPNGVWLWIAADNLRIAALTAVECAESMIATRPAGEDSVKASRWRALLAADLSLRELRLPHCRARRAASRKRQDNRDPGV